MIVSVNWVIIGSRKGFSPVRHQAVTWINAELSSMGPWEKHFNEILFKIQTFSFKRMHLKFSSLMRYIFQWNFIQKSVIFVQERPFEILVTAEIYILMKFHSKFRHFHWRKCIWNSSVQKVDPFVSASVFLKPMRSCLVRQRSYWLAPFSAGWPNNISVSHSTCVDKNSIRCHDS